MINIKDLLTLDDENEYVVVSKVKYNDKNYYYLLDIKDNSNFKFCYEDGEELVQIGNKKLISKLLPLFIKESLKENYN